MSTLEELKKRVEGTNIDLRSMLSTDYFNHFNETIMLLNMLPDAPELLEEIEKWDFKTYRDHFMESSLAFAPLAIECYDSAPPELRDSLEKLITRIAMMIAEMRVRLRHTLDAGERDKFNHMAIETSMNLQKKIDEGGAIVHGCSSSLDQSAIDSMF